MIHKVKKFLSPYLGEAPLLLALSGGPDSMALYYALKELGVNFECAHIDHGWRESSQKEAEWLKSVVPGLHVLTLSKSDFKGNLEEAGRRLRFQFLKEIAKKVGAKTILTAHHADDQAETVMKRLFEKVPPYSLRGISSVSEFEDLLLLRPLLNSTKQELLSYLGERKYLIDETNIDGPFLRAKMRKEMLPFLNEAFGKNCNDSFVKFHEEIEALQSYLKRQTESKYQKTEGPLGSFLALDADPYELKGMIVRFLKEEGLPVNYHLIDGIVENRFKSNIKFNDLYLDRCFLFNIKSNHELIEPIKLTDLIQIGPWTVRADSEKGGGWGWKSYFMGEVSTLAEGDLWLAPPDQETLKRRQADKIAQVLRISCPIIKNEKGDIYDFLRKPKKNLNSPCRILLKFTSLC